MLPTQHRQHRTSIPATGLGSILVAAPQLALVADRGVVAQVAVAVGMGEGAFTAADRRPWADATRGPGGADDGAPDSTAAGRGNDADRTTTRATR